MNTNRILIAVLALFLLSNQPIMAAEPNTSNIIDRAKKEWREFKEAVSCLRKKGFRACSRAQKARIIAAGIALAVVSATAVYVIKPRTFAQQARLNSKLATAIFDGTIFRVKMLIWQGADINTPIGGITPLHHAVTHNRLDIVKFLISKKATVNDRTSSHLTALDLARGKIETYLKENTDAKTDDLLKAEGR